MSRGRHPIDRVSRAADRLDAAVNALSPAYYQTLRDAQTNDAGPAGPAVRRLLVVAEHAHSLTEAARRADAEAAAAVAQTEHAAAAPSTAAALEYAAYLDAGAAGRAAVLGPLYLSSQRHAAAWALQDAGDGPLDADTLRAAAGRLRALEPEK